MYVYIESKAKNTPLKFLVGFYRQRSPGDDRGTEFMIESKYNNRDDAAERVNFLNGGVPIWALDNIVNLLNRT